MVVPTAELGGRYALPSWLYLLPSTVVWIQFPNLKGGCLIIAGYFKFRREEGGEKQTVLRIEQRPFIFFIWELYCLALYLL